MTDREGSGEDVAPTNATLRLIEARRSTRTYDDAPVTDREREAILRAAMRSPTAGNMMLYSIIHIEDQALKERLAETCDDQPFIAKAPLVLLFLADYQKWTDLFVASDVRSLEGVDHRDTLGPGDLMLACSDALIAAQTAVIAAESLGIGSCYIGDIMERGEDHAEILGLPPHTFPVTMVCFGRASRERPPTPHYTADMVYTDGYRRATDTELTAKSAELAQMHSPHGFKPGIENYGQAVYERKFTSDFMADMNRSVAWWLERWGSAARRP